MINKRFAYVAGVLVLCIFVGPRAHADTPDAHLTEKGGTYGVANLTGAPDGEGKDQLYTTATQGRIKPTYAYIVQGDADVLEIDPEKEHVGERIHSATVTGRDPNDDILLVVTGVFVPGGGGAGGAQPEVRKWEANYNKGGPRLLPYVNSVSPDDDFVLKADPEETGSITVYLAGVNPTGNNDSYVVTFGDAPGGGEVGFAQASVTLGRVAGVWVPHATAKLTGKTEGQTTITLDCNQGGVDDSATASATVFTITMGAIKEGSSPHTGNLVVGHDYAFEYTLTPSGVNLDCVTFVISYGSGTPTRIYQKDVTNVVSGTHEEPWEATKWNLGANYGAYANPKNGTYSAGFVLRVSDTEEYAASDAKTFCTELVIEADLEDDKPSTDEISSGLYQPRETNQVKIGLKPSSGDIIWATGTRTWGTQETADLDNDAGDEIKKDHVKQVFQSTIYAGYYKVVIQGLRDVAGNEGPGGETGVIEDWTIQLH